jgi:transcriptional regulator with XRE-family HTH domain
MATITSPSPRQLREQGVQEGWDLARIVTRIQGSGEHSALAAHRLARGWTLEETAARLTALREPGAEQLPAISPQMLCSWERQRVTPSLANAELMCRLYRTRIDRLGLVRDYSAPVIALTAAHPAGPSGGDGACQDDTGFPSVLPPEVRRMSALARRGFDGLGHDPVEPSSLTRLEQAADAFRTQDWLADPRHLSAVITGLREVDHLGAAGTPQAFLRRRHRLVARLADLAGSCLLVLGHFPDAVGWFQTALRAAGQGGSEHSRVRARIQLAIVAAYAESPTASLTRARRAEASAGSTGPAAWWSMDTAARAHARLDQPRQALHYLRRIETSCARSHPATAASPRVEVTPAYGPRQLAALEGTLSSYQGDYDRARRAFDLAVAQLPPGHDTVRALYRLDLAVGLARGCEISEACRAVEEVLACQGQPCGLVLHHAREVLRHVPPRYQALDRVRALGQDLKVEGRTA